MCVYTLSIVMKCAIVYFAVSVLEMLMKRCVVACVYMFSRFVLLLTICIASGPCQSVLKLFIYREMGCTVCTLSAELEYIYVCC